MIKATNILLVAGGGRNVGKTTFVCNLIKENPSVIAIKISPHIHDLSEMDKKNILFTYQDAVVVKEVNDTTTKDSSLFLQAGANEVLYIQASDATLPHLIPFIIDYINNRPCICESGGFRKYIIPGTFIFITRNVIVKENAMIHQADHVIRDFNFSAIQIKLVQNQWSIV